MKTVYVSYIVNHIGPVHAHSMQICHLVHHSLLVFSAYTAPATTKGHCISHTVQGAVKVRCRKRVFPYIYRCNLECLSMHAKYMSMLWPTAWSERVILYIGSICMHVCTEHAVFCFEPRTNVGKHSIKWTTTATDLSFIVWLPGFPHWWSYWMLTPSFTALWFCMCWRIYCMLHTVECNGWWISLLVVQYSDYNECRLTMQLLLWGSTTECTAG